MKEMGETLTIGTAEVFKVAAAFIQLIERHCPQMLLACFNFAYPNFFNACFAAKIINMPTRRGR